ncbi:MAG: polysaccharide pyruvyl transferase family protein, partial [Actinomycetota bacterium]|nr:polysaccharide pyruvyl transferase family protein [Actinomycetota bacterium]
MPVPIRIAIHGYLGYHNVGDEAILAVTLRELRRRIPEVEPMVISGDPAWTEKLHGVEAVADDSLPEVAACVRQASLVISGGGGLFQDYWHRDNAELLSFPAPGVGRYAQVALLAELYGKPLVLMGHGVGPIVSREGARLVSFVAGLADRITVRDDGSRELLQRLGCGEKVTTVAPDPAFAFPVPVREEARRHLLQRLDLEEAGEPLVAVCLRPWGEAEADWAGRLAEGLAAFLSTTNARLLFVPFQEADRISDSAQARIVASAISRRDRCHVLDERPPADVMDILAGCDGVLAMRLHGAIFGLASRVPVLALAYDPKVGEAMRLAGQDHHILQMEEVGRLGEALVELLEEAPKITEQLGEVVPGLAAQAQGHFEGLAELAVTGAGTETPEGRLSARLVDRKTLSDELLEYRARWEQSERRFLQYYWEKEAYIHDLQRQLGVARAVGLMGPVWLAKQGAKRALRFAKQSLPKVVPAQWRLLYKDLRRPVYGEEGRSEARIYHTADQPLPTYPLSVEMGGRAYRERVHVSVVATVRNGADSMGEWLGSLLRQTRLPDEVVIVDGGSTDGTLEILQRYAEEAPFPVEVIAAGPVNIAQGRNLAISAAENPVIAVTDSGCHLDDTWLANLVGPFEVDPQVQVAVGWYEAQAETIWGRAMAMNLVPALADVDPAGLLPSSRSLAFTKAAWELVGGYPEWLSLTGEDTYFALELRARCPSWAFVPQARVVWQGPETLGEGLAKGSSWSRGDGEAGLFSGRYWHLFKRLLRDGLLLAALLASMVAGVVVHRGWLVIPLGIAVAGLAFMGGRWSRLGRRPEAQGGAGRAALLLWALSYPLMRAARVVGFARGVLGRPQALSRRMRDMRGTVFILSGVPITDSGGGQRAAQLALAFLEQNHLVVFVNKFPSYETVHLDIKMGHPLLLTYSLHTFDLEAFLRRYPVVLDKPRTAIVEFPLPEFVDLAEEMRAVGGTVVYDCIDDWTTSLGGYWYSPETEGRLISASQVLVATAPPLRERLETLSGRGAALVPNAVNTGIFHPDGYPRPADLGSGDFVICYVGALWGEWFDWHLLRKVAMAYPEASVVVIGDYRGQLSDPPPNLRFLGLKPQRELPAYLTHSDVAIIPWVVSRLTDATNPLKVYEYLAMRKPVVAPRIRGLEGVPYLLLADDEEQFIAHIDRARELEVDGEAVERFIEENSWGQRVQALLGLIEGAASGEAPLPPSLRGRARGGGSSSP